MENQFAVWIAILFGFTSCTETPDEQFASELVGTWKEVRTTHADGDDGREWVSTHRKTVILEKVNGKLRFRNCIDDTFATATVKDEIVTLSGDDYPTLELSEPDTLTAVETAGDTEVALYRVSTEINTVMADLDLNSPQDLSTWTQLCVETMVAEDDTNILAFKAANSLLGLTVGMTFTFDAPIAQGTYTYSDSVDTHTATGIYKFPDELGGTIEGTLSDPVGPVIVSENATWDFQADLTMQSSSFDDDTPINGLLQIDPEWFETE